MEETLAPTCQCEKKEEDKKKLSVTLARITASLVLALLGYFVFNEDHYGVFVNLAFMLSAWLISAYDLVYEAFRNLIKEKNPFDENMLMTVASIGAFCLRFFGKDDNEFIEAVMVVLLYQIGELFEDLATEKSHKAITEAIGLRPHFASKLEGDKLERVTPESLQVNDIILVKVGEIVPADGTVIRGEGSLDMSSLTGEFIPVAKAKGDFVNSGTILKTGSISLRVDKPYADSTVSKILRLMEESEKGKSNAEKFITKFSRVYTPIVVFLALLVAVLPPLFLGISSSSVWFQWLYTAICLLVISCPCAIVISVPLAYFAGIGLASKNGVVIKGAAYFDKLNELGVLVSDKTGTLTRGDFTVTKEAPFAMNQAHFHELLLASESRSNHPLAKAITRGADLSPFAKKVSHYEEKAGLGESLLYDKKPLLAGNKTLLESHDIQVPDVEETGTVIYLAYDGQYVGYALLNDTIRKESHDMVTSLTKLGVRTVMLTGDKKKSAENVASSLGISECHSELLPEDKTRLLREEIDETPRTVAYIGDGINDAPSISLADVGVAMGGAGSDMAIDSADIVIMNDDPSKVVTAVKIAQKTRRRAIENIVIALTVKLVIMVLAIVIPTFPLLFAVLADTGLTVLLIGNSMLLLSSKVRKN